jgi:hypothetical protein
MDFEDQEVEEQVDDWGDDWEADDDDDSSSSAKAASSSSSKKSSSSSSSSSAADAAISERKSSFNVLEPRQIQSRQAAVIDEVCDMLGISPSDASIVLHHYRFVAPILI